MYIFGRKIGGKLRSSDKDNKARQPSPTSGQSSWFIRNGSMMLKKQTTLFGEQINPLRIFTAQELREATNNYSSGAISPVTHVGVFRATIDGRPVCVTVKDRPDDIAVEESVNEIVALANLRHRHIVQIVGCCLETRVPLAVYEFIPNGTLAHHIFHGSLGWADRLRLATEVADALCYLHSQRVSPIIHRNVEPTNVLLDETGSAKLIDFGLSIAFPLGKTQIRVDRIGVPVGAYAYYCDPEYPATGIVTEKTDVYAYGMLLVVLFTGRFPDRNSVTEMLGAVQEVIDSSLVTPTPRNHQSRAGTASPQMTSSKLRMDAIEKYLLTHIDRPICTHGEGEVFTSQLHLIMQIIQRCLHLSGKDRPPMNQVVRELRGMSRMQTSSTVPNKDEASILSHEISA